MIPKDIGFKTTKAEDGTITIEGSIVFSIHTELSPYTPETPQAHAIAKNTITSAINYALIEWLKEHKSEALNNYYQERLREEGSGYYDLR